MFCGECGASIGPQDRACPSCGAPAQIDPHPHAAVSMAAIPRSGFGVLGITRGILNALSEGKVIRRSIAVVLQIGAVLVLIAALVMLVLILKQSFQAGTSAGATVGGIIMALLLAAALFGVSQIYLFRANSVRELADSPFTVVPIVSILFRAAGESYAVVGLALGVGGCVFTWLTGANPGGLLTVIGSNFGPFTPALAGQTGNGPFLDGLVFLAGLAIMAFVALVSFYALAEMVVVIVDIALNVRKIENRDVAAPASSGR
jgi:hypothetical protein